MLCKEGSDCYLWGMQLQDFRRFECRTIVFYDDIVLLAGGSVEPLEKGS